MPGAVSCSHRTIQLTVSLPLSQQQANAFCPTSFQPPGLGPVPESWFKNGDITCDCMLRQLFLQTATAQMFYIIGALLYVTLVSTLKPRVYFR